MPEATDVIEKPDTKPAADAAPADKASKSDAKLDAKATGKAAGEKPVADKASATDKGKAPAKATARAEADDDATDEVDDTEQTKGTSRDERWLSDEDEADGADKADGKKAADPDGKTTKAKPDDSVDWREEFVKSAESKLLKKAKTDDDKKAVTAQIDRLKKQVSRYGSIEAAALAGMEAQERLRSGQGKARPHDDATPEEKAAWREEQGLPKAPDEIVIPPVQITGLDGRRITHKWTDRDQPLIDSFREVAFELNLPQENVNKLANWFVNGGMTATKWELEAKSALDKGDRKTLRSEFREEFGDEAETRTGLIPRYINDTRFWPSEVAAKLWEARTPDGHLLVYDPHFAKFMSEQALAELGEGELEKGDRIEARTNRLSEIRTVMKTDYDKYLREGLDKEMATLLEKEEKKAGRRGRAA